MLVECAVCGNEFQAVNSRFKTCGKACKEIYKKQYDYNRQKNNTERLEYINEKNKERYHKKRKVLLDKMKM